MKALYTSIISVLLTTSVASAQQIAEFGREHTYTDRSSIIIQDTDAPNAVAELIFNNEMNNNPEDLVPSVTYDGIVVNITFEFNVYGGADDTISVSVSPGYYTEPETTQVMEGFSGTILIYPELTS